MPITLEKATNREWVRWWAVYRNANEDFSQAFFDRYRDLFGVPYCYWLLRDGQRVGGVIQAGEDVGDLFLIPPFDDVAAAVDAVLLPETTHARSILAGHVAAFEAAGFTVTEGRRWMLRPTQAYTPRFGLPRRAPQTGDAAAIAEVMAAAFAGEPGDYGRRDLAGHHKSVRDFFRRVKHDPLWLAASSVVHEGPQMVAACLVQPYKTHASLRFVVTRPTHEGRGLAIAMMQHALDHVRHMYPYMALAVTLGTRAEGFYRRRGFVPGPATFTLAR